MAWTVSAVSRGHRSNLGADGALGADAATVYTLEGGLVGVIPGANFTAGQLRGEHCDAPNACQNLPYTALPDGGFVDQGAASLHSAIIRSDEDVLAVGHSEGGQVIYELLRDYDTNPTSAPDPAEFSWISIGNPENKFGGVPWSGYGGERGFPEDTAYSGTEVIRQYDGWADWPDDSSNLLAVANAVVGMQTIHTDYTDVDITSPGNATTRRGTSPTSGCRLTPCRWSRGPARSHPRWTTPCGRPWRVPMTGRCRFPTRRRRRRRARLSPNPRTRLASRELSSGGNDFAPLRPPKVRNSLKAIPGEGAAVEPAAASRRLAAGPMVEPTVLRR